MFVLRATILSLEKATFFHTHPLFQIKCPWALSHVFMEPKCIQCRHVLKFFTKQHQFHKLLKCVRSVKTLIKYSDILENLVPILLINHYLVGVSSWVDRSPCWYVTNTSVFVKLITENILQSTIQFLHLDEFLLWDSLPFNDL